MDDGSTEAEAKDVFDAMARKYEPRGWMFLRQENAFVDAARNRAARHSDSEYLFFIDADDLIPPHAIERMLEAAVISGVDCLVSASVLFSGRPAALQHDRAVYADRRESSGGFDRADRFRRSDDPDPAESLRGDRRVL